MAKFTESSFVGPLSPNQELNRRIRLGSYVHRSVSNFYIRYGSNVVLDLTKAREKHYDQMISRYTKNTISTIDNKSLAMIENTLNADEIVETISKEGLKALNANVSTAISSLSDSLAVNKKDAATAMMSAASANAIDQASERLKQLDLMLEAIKETAKIMFGSSDQHNALLVILNNAIKNRTVEKSVSELIKKDLSKMETGSQVSASLERQKSIAKKIAKMAMLVESNFFGSGSSIKEKSIASYCNDLFSKEFGEFLVESVVDEGKINKLAVEYVQSTLSGTPNVECKEDIIQRGNQSWKVDNVMKNVKLKIECADEEIEVLLDIGLSIKNYQSKVTAVRATTEASLMNRINQIAKASNTNVGLMRNIIANRYTLKDEYTALLNNISTHFADVFISGIGGEDFSSYILINGKFYSIYDILLKMKTEQGFNDDIIVTTVNNIRSVTSIQSKRKSGRGSKANPSIALTNSDKVSRAIDKLGFQTKFKLRNYKNLLS